MTSTRTDEIIAVLASGGLDSSILISELLRQGRQIQPLYVRSDLVWERDESQSLRRYLQVVDSPKINDLAVLSLPLEDLYGDHWSTSGEDTPGGDTADEAVFLPGRNALLVVKAAVWCQLNGVGELALAPLGTSPFADATEQFFDHAQAMFNCYPGKPLRIVLPFSGFNKRQVMQRGRDCPLELTFSCISPVEGIHCGRCNKCAERRQAFREVGLDDSTRYAS
ncbi:MAG: 7-cyano-7-deazaguanine synthase [Planctomycetes bacterium]|nr:7-cyano-7-deazaguanine synthase [Planctomycetota bacterium]MBL7037383.1 7-cyano-7-deazaguanine synthase [Pirellulaceae bacterium]